jgi:hypothetical protein
VPLDEDPETSADADTADSAGADGSDTCWLGVPADAEPADGAGADGEDATWLGVLAAPDAEDTAALGVLAGGPDPGVPETDELQAPSASTTRMAAPPRALARKGRRMVDS